MLRKLTLILLVSAALAHAGPLDEGATRTLLERIRAERAGRTITADFQEKKYLPLMQEPVIESGTVAFEPPDRFLRRTSTGNLAASDGTTLWMFYPAFQQAEKYPLAAARGPGQLFAALSRMFQLDELEKNFRVQVTALADGYQFDLVPRSGMVRRMLKKATLILSGDLKLRASTIWGETGDRMETAYSNERFLAPGEVSFAFTPPSGTSVVSPLGN